MRLINIEISEQRLGKWDWCHEKYAVQFCHNDFAFNLYTLSGDNGDIVKNVFYSHRQL